MDDAVELAITTDEPNGPLLQGKPLGRRWKVLASVNLFILSLKSKWRRNRKANASLDDSNTACGVPGPRPMVLFDNWIAVTQIGPPASQPSSRRGSPIGLHCGQGERPGSSSSSRRTRRRRSSGVQSISTRRMSVKSMWQNLTRAKSSDSPERRHSVLGVADLRDGYHWPTSVTRQLAFGPWENAASRSRLQGYLMKVPFAKVITLAIFFICVIVVTVIYVKEAEVEQKLKQRMDE